MVTWTMHLQTLMMIIVVLTKNSLLSGMASIVTEALFWRLVMLQMISTQLSLAPSIHDYKKSQHNKAYLIPYIYNVNIHLYYTYMGLAGVGKWPVKHWGSKFIFRVSLHTGIDSSFMLRNWVFIYARILLYIYVATHLPLCLKYSALLPMFNC